MITTETYRAVVSGMATCLALVTLGCTAAMPKSGFLEDYSAFELIHDDAPVWDLVDPEGLGKGDRVLKIWADRPNLDELAKYDRFINDPSVVRLHENSPGNWVNPDKLKKFVAEMDSVFAEGLAEHYPQVDTPAEGVIRFRAAVTDISPAFLYESP